MAASMLRGAAASALRRRSFLLPTANGAPLLPLPRALHNSAAAPPPAVTTAAQRHLSTAEDAISEWERKAELQRAEKNMGEILRHLLLEDAVKSSQTGWDKKRSTEKLEEYLRRQIKIDAAGAPVLAPGDVDKQLLLALLVRWTKAEEKLSLNTAKLVQLEKQIEPIKMLANFMAHVVFKYLPVSVAALYGISYVRSLF